jgi:hypothetical protein
MTKVTKEPTGAHSPYYGCLILLMVVCTFGGIGAWTLYSGYKQDKEISLFTVNEPTPLPLAEVSAEEKTALQGRLNTFATDAIASRSATLSLSLSDLNSLLILSGEAGVADYRGILRFTGLDGKTKTLLADLCWEMNQLPFSDKGKRYLVGSGAFSPVIENDSLDVKINTLSVPGKTVSYGFLRNLQNWPWLNLAKLKPEIKSVVDKVTSWEISEDGSALLLKSGPKG